MHWTNILIEGMKLLIALLSVVVWPATVLAVVWWFRAEIKSKIQSLRIWQGLGMNMDFHDGLREAEELAIDATPTKAQVGESTPEDAESTSREEPYISPLPEVPVAQTTAPSRIIDETFRQLAADLRRRAGALGYTNAGQKRYVASIVRDLIRNQTMPEVLGEMILKLRELRNVAAARPFDMNADDVIRYMRLAEDAKQGILSMPEPKDERTGP